MDKLMLKVPEVAKILRIGRAKAYDLVREGVIPSIKMGKSIRVPMQGLINWMEQDGRKMVK